MIIIFISEEMDVIFFLSKIISRQEGELLFLRRFEQQTGPSQMVWGLRIVRA